MSLFKKMFSGKKEDVASAPALDNWDDGPLVQEAFAACKGVVSVDEMRARCQYADEVNGRMKEIKWMSQHQQDAYLSKIILGSISVGS